MPRIRVYARLRPTSRRYEGLQVNGSRVKIALGDKDAEKFTSAQYKEREYKFQKVFDEGVTQEEVYDETVHHMVERFLEGYNGTIFAYGQTASGKTYTIEGSARSYAERGIIPRALSHIYSTLKEREEEYLSSVHISFMEIYQDIGYDLLNPGGRGDSMMVTLPKVAVMEDEDGASTVRNLTSHLATSEEVAVSLLFQGCTCRRVAETSMNKRSSRSHGVFTIMLTSQKRESEIITKSKLHLVDLAGSERVAKTGADGQILQEAKYINLSLHCLEHVIVILQRQAMKEQEASSKSSSSIALGSPGRSPTNSPNRSRDGHRSHLASRGGGGGGGERGRTPEGVRHVDSSEGFVPYRNSLLTMVLRDSLGGNCLTAMIATISIEKRNIMETLSTCRFAQRVACVSNTARRNQELDDKAVIRKLRIRIAELENEVALLRQTSDFTITRESASITLQPDDKKLCHKILYDFLHGRTSNPVTAGIDSPAKFQECLSVLKEVVLSSIRAKRKTTTTNSLSPSTTRQPPAPSSTTHSLPRSERSSNSPISEDHMQNGPTSSRGVACESLSPIPRSQLSSGFVSLLDEEAAIHSQTHTPSPTARVVQHTHKPTTSNTLKLDKQHRQRTHSVSPVRNSKHSVSPPHRQVMSAASPHTTSSPSPQQAAAAASQSHTSPSTRQTNESAALRGELAVLSLKVKNENLRRDIAMVNEQLATQHAKVLRLEQSETTTQDQLLAEKIAEKQLKIKQTRLNQQLVDVEHQQKLQSITTATHTLKTAAPQTTTTTTATITPQPRHHSHSHTPATHSADAEMKQNKKKEDLEELRLLQMEKQLELKEAATRRRLLALKQQLQNEATATASSTITSTTSPQSHKPHPPELKPTSPRITEAMQKLLTSNTSPPPDHTQLTYISIQSKTSPRSPIVSLKSPAEETPVTQGHTDKEVYVSAESSSNELERTSSQAGREMRYMSAVKHQKARVARMRQCMLAASIIQTAWRRHKRRRT